jgi:hypothetical protein
MTHHTHRKAAHAGNGSSRAMAVARGLGWFSVGLGALEILAPRGVTRFFGLRGGERLVQACGVRELATGAGILASQRPAPWMWGRVAGDAADLAALMAAYGGGARNRGNVGLALLAMAGVTALDVLCARSLGTRKPRELKPIRDYSDRVGLRASPDEMRGAARDLKGRHRMGTPEALRPYTTA